MCDIKLSSLCIVFVMKRNIQKCDKAKSIIFSNLLKQGQKLKLFIKDNHLIT